MIPPEDPGPRAAWWALLDGARGRLEIDIVQAFRFGLSAPGIGELHGALSLMGWLLRDLGGEPDRICATLVRDSPEDVIDGSVDEEEWDVAFALEVLLEHAVAAHREIRGRHQRCGCGATTSCRSDATSFRDLLDHMRLDHLGPVVHPTLLELAARHFAHRAQLAEISEHREVEPTTAFPEPSKHELDEQLLLILRDHRSELRTRELLARIPETTSAQIGGRLRSLESRGLVEIQRYRNPKNGFEINAWRATFPYER